MKRTALLQLMRNVGAFAISCRIPSRRAWAALAKLQGRRLERRWPFLGKANPAALNLAFDDLLEFQYARSRRLQVMVVGAYDGMQNDPIGHFVLKHDCDGVFVEPQPGAFARLRANLGSRRNLHCVNAAVDGLKGERQFFHVPPGLSGLPAWSEQLGSFCRAHIEKHEASAPGLSAHISSIVVPTTTFDSLLDEFQIGTIDVLQIDAEGMDAQLLSGFPFHRTRPALLHYEIAHMTPHELSSTRAMLSGLGYRLLPAESMTDEMAVLV